jgi:hypothetical protein
VVGRRGYAGFGNEPTRAPISINPSSQSGLLNVFRHILYGFTYLSYATVRLESFTQYAIVLPN